ncbi:MAG: hypothetical protein FWD36_03355 [Treponema sp.]|nr:hypothetical protein [Treponema sp.]
MKELKTLIGDDSMIFTGDQSDVEYAGDGVKTIDELVNEEPGKNILDQKMCVIKTRAQTGSIFADGLVPGELFPAIGTEVPAAGDTFYFLKLAHVADCSSWRLGITQGEIDVTKLKDRFRKYRLGKKDAQLTLSSIFTIGESDEKGSVINRNMKLFKRCRDGTVEVTDEANRALYMIGYVNKAALPEETDAFVFCQIYLYNVSLGGQSGSAQSYDASGRLTGIDPVFYSLEVQTA